MTAQPSASTPRISGRRRRSAWPHAVLVARDFLGDDEFVMYLGDNFIVGGITELVEEFKAKRPDAQIMLTQVSDPSAFGIAELNESGHIVSLEEKPLRPKSNLAMVGVYMFTPVSHEAVRQLKPSWRGELEITEAIQWMIDLELDVRSTAITGYWRGSRIVGPAIIGAGTKITGSYLGPFTSVAEECSIDDSEIEYSIVLRGASICGVRRIEASIIGHDVEVTPAPHVRKAHRLVLGDHSEVQISS